MTFPWSHSNKEYFQRKGEQIVNYKLLINYINVKNIFFLPLYSDKKQKCFLILIQYVRLPQDNGYIDLITFIILIYCNNVRV